MFSKKYLFSVVIVSMFAASSVNASDEEHSHHHDEHDGEMKSCEAHKSHHKCNMMSKMDADNDGNISLKEFMRHHRDMFDKADTNNDRLIDEDEMKAMMKHMHGHKHEHKHDDDQSHDHDH